MTLISPLRLPAPGALANQPVLPPHSLEGMLILETFLISHFPIRPSLFKSLWAATITTKPSLDATSRAPFLCTAVAKEGLGSKARDLLSSSHLPTLLLVNNLAKTAFNQNNSFLSKYLLCSIRYDDSLPFQTVMAV